MGATQDEMIAELERSNAELRRERDASLAREAALAEVLGVINRSPGDPQPVFDAILQKAHDLCGADSGALHTYDGTHQRAVAVHGYSEALEDQMRQPREPNRYYRRLIDGERHVQIPDMLAIDAGDDGGVAQDSARTTNARTVLAVSLWNEDGCLGFISAFRYQVRPFSDTEIALLESFAAQAVIAMENARLITEQREALERQTATAEVLQVINASPGNLAPVFDAMLEKAMRLCGAAFGRLVRREGDMVQSLASRGLPPALAAWDAENRLRPVGPAGLHIYQTKRPFPMLDMRETESYRSGNPSIRAVVDLGGGRSNLLVPLVKDETVIGYFHVFRQEVRGFADNEISLLESFAAQAVIAMENARLLTEQQEALERQTATAEVLEVINASPGNLAPVFDAMLDKAMRLCGVAFGTLQTWDGEHIHNVAHRGLPASLAAWLDCNRTRKPGTAALRLIETRRSQHALDMMEGEGYRAGQPGPRAIAELGGGRTNLLVPLLKDDAVLGYFNVFRQEVRAFSDKEIALLENFAAQAVIAMENARLLTEQREALEQQTATAEVLGVINSSPGDLTPVFQTMLDRALQLCGAAFGELGMIDGDVFTSLAVSGMSEEFSRVRVHVPQRPGPATFTWRLRHGETVVHYPNLMDTDAYRDGEPVRRTLVDAGGARAGLAVALRKDDALLGQLAIYRRSPGPFTDRQIALLENFAAQAVIAMANARLLTEQREALERQTATAEVLQVINASPGNLAPVFDAMLEKAMRLCGAAFGTLRGYDGEYVHALATRGVPAAYAEYTGQRRTTPPPGGGMAQALASGRTVQLLDTRESQGYRDGNPNIRAIADLGGARTVLFVPLVKDAVSVGFFTIYRQEVRAFTDKQISLLENFAAQAVIAIENARLLQELRATTEEVARREEELRVTFENMGDGVAMFDAAQRLVAWNRKFQDILDVPDEVIARRQTFSEYIRYLAERGEYGGEVDTDEQVHRLTEQAGQSRVFERTRPDGRVIEIHHNPVPSGGFVVIYSDITERKRNEAAIAAARDAAEEAARTIEAAYRDLKIAQANLIQAEKMASLGQLTAGIAHEIKNPLNFVNNFSDLSVELLDELKDAIAPAAAALTQDQRDEVDEVVATLSGNLQKINQHGKRADSIVKAMLEHSRGASAERRAVDLNALADEALNLAYHGARAQDVRFNITLERDFGDGIAPIEVNPQDITRVLLNLFSNGFYAATKRAHSNADDGFRPTLRLTTRGGGEMVEIRVRDNGTGIAPDIREKLFQPFFTTKPTGEGTGLGLSITYDIVTKAHGGTIAVDSEVDEFTEFVVTLPRRMFAPEGARA